MPADTLVGVGVLAQGTGGFLGEVIRYLLENRGALLGHTIDHAILVTRALIVAVPLGITLGVVITYDDRLATVVLWIAGIMMTIPSLALFALLIPSLGTGSPPVVFGLILYTQLPMIRNTYVGLTGVDQSAVEAGTGLGMTKFQRLRQIQLPMALPVVMSGLRNAVVLLVGIAAIGEVVNAGGLGAPIFAGYRANYMAEIVGATIALALLTLAVDYVLGVIEQLLRLRNGEEIEPNLGTRAVLALSKLAPSRVTGATSEEPETTRPSTSSGP